MLEQFINSIVGNAYISAVVICALPLGFLIVYALIAILIELKVSAWMQDRLGPMRTGWYGVLQPIAEVIKLMQKEDITPDRANKTLFNISPFIIFTGAFAALAVIPFSSGYVAADINIGLFYVFAIGAFSVIAIVMGGWASNNKYSLIGAVRAVAQIVSYEVPAAMALLTVAAMAGSLNMQEINQFQSGWFWNWYIFGGPGTAIKLIFIPFTITLFLIYFIAGLAETNRTPFDIPEGESELVSGYHTEYSGMKFAMFFFAEYSNMFIVCALTAILFFGGWNSPFGDIMSGPYWGFFWFLSKTMFFIFIQIWLRWTLPRLRVDQLMFVSWKVFLPISLLCFLVLSFYRMIQ